MKVGAALCFRCGVAGLYPLNEEWGRYSWKRDRLPLRTVKKTVPSVAPLFFFQRWTGRN
jgi:hypothetical protein